MNTTTVSKEQGMASGHQQGVGLIEVLVALLVFAVGVLGYAGLQLGALKGTEVAHSRALATGIAQDFLDRILVNPQGDYVDASLWSTDYPDIDEPEDWKACISGTCSETEMADWDIKSVRWHAVRALPAGRVSVLPCKSSGAMTCVVVAWGEQEPDKCLTDTGVARGLDVECVVMEVAR